MDVVVGDRIRTCKALVSSLKEKASSAYYAPLEAKDARRMKQIAELITKPFVVLVGLSR